MRYRIIPTAETYFHSLYLALDSVCREQQFLAFLQAPPRELSLDFYHSILINDYCQFLALRDEEVVGWCDILPCHGEARTHIGTLGMGLIASVRRQGLGTQLITAALDKAKSKGMTRIELIVRVDNQAALALYERFGFKIEALQPRALKLAGQYIDAYAMALLC